MPAPARILVGALKGPHGLQGWVKLKPMLENHHLLISAGPCELEAGTHVVVKAIKTVGQGLIALQIADISTPEAATALRGGLFLPPGQIPVSDDEILLADLIGEPLYGPGGQEVGRITGLTTLPAGEALQITVPGKKVVALVPLEEDFIVLDADPLRAELTELGLGLLSL